LAHIRECQPGLPRGRARLPIETVRATQQERLLRAIVAAEAETGFRRCHGRPNRLARPASPPAFYAHFADKKTPTGRLLPHAPLSDSQTRMVPAGEGSARAKAVKFG
jgi:hypothetical protein